MTHCDLETTPHKLTLPPHGTHQVIDPPALHFGAPVVLVSTRDHNGNALVRPISACTVLGDRIWLGFQGPGQTRTYLEHQRECVVNIPQADLAQALNAFQSAASAGHAGDGFQPTGLTPIPAETVSAPRVRECYVQIECTLVDVHNSNTSTSAFAELEVQRVHAVADIVRPGARHIDVDAWNPLLYSFQEFFTTARVRKDNADQL